MTDQKPTASGHAVRRRRSFWPESWIVRAGLAVGFGWLLLDVILSHRASSLSRDEPAPAVALPSSRPGNSAAEIVEVRRISYRGEAFAIAEVDLTRAPLKLFWKRPDGNPFGGFDELQAHLTRSSERLVFATNAGIFEPGYVPSGLHVEDGQECVPLNLKAGAGNFYLKPNGVFLVDDRGARIIDAATYEGTHGGIRLAVQSGPLLALDGKLHSAFAADSSNRRKRSGVGIVSAGRIVFAISEEPVTFHTFASLFVEKLDCRDALYLDGVISRFAAPADGLEAVGGDYAGILAVTGRLRQ